MTLVQAIWIAVVQGATELFPISSLGHAVILPALTRSAVDEGAQQFLPFLVLLHVGTGVALIGFFWPTWLSLADGVLGRGTADEIRDRRRLFMLVVVATIPAIIAGGLLEHRLRQLFASPLTVCFILAMNGVMLIICERLRVGRRSVLALSRLGIVDALLIGVWQCLALLPGMSRSGATIIGGLLRGLDHEDAAHFSFLIAVPIIIAATALELPKLLHASIPADGLAILVLAAAVAGATAFISTWLLMRLFKKSDRWSLLPFGLYCIVFAALSAAIITWRK